MSNHFIVEKSSVDRFDFVVYGTEAKSVLSSLGKIQAELKGVKNAVVLFDHLLYAGNTKNRFITATVKDGRFDMDSFKITKQINGNDVRKMAKAFFHRHAEFVRSNSILNSVQRELLLKGAAI